MPVLTGRQGAIVKAFLPSGVNQNSAVELVIATSMNIQEGASRWQP